VPKLLALHGQTLNGAYMRRELAQLEQLGVELVCPDAPHVCADGVVDRLYAVWDQPRQPAPYCAWWDASDDGRTYRGWDATLDSIVPLLDDGPLGILGFSQGAILATALAALSQHGQLPPIAYVILVAGRAPRADVITPYLSEPLRTRSLHVWGENDQLSRDASRDLVERFAPETRTVATWDGAHTLPTSGTAAANAIAHFVTSGGR
jgi:hypothetical protein